MAVPCVRVRPEDGEATRRRLAADDLVADEYAITASDGWLHIPITDPDAVPPSETSGSSSEERGESGGIPEEFEVVEFDAPERRTPTNPADILGFEPTYERLGDVVILDEDDPERAQRIADAILESDVRAESVVNRASKVKGTERVRDWDVLAGDGTEAVHREYGCEFELDLATVYFSPRLATERHRVVEQIERVADQREATEGTSGGAASHEDEHVFDMFAGVGPYAVPMAKAGPRVVATDINEDAIAYLKRNAERNNVTDRITAIVGDVRDVADEYENWADRVVMNLPHTADKFLDTAVALAGDDCVIHLYDFEHEDDPYGPAEAAIRDAAEPEYDVEIETRRTVRSYAPHELNVVVDARLTRR